MAKCTCDPSDQDLEDCTSGKGDKFTKCKACRLIFSWGKHVAGKNNDEPPAKKQAPSTMDRVLVDLVRMCSQHDQLVQDVRLLERTLKEVQSKVATRNFIDDNCTNAITSP